MINYQTNRCTIKQCEKHLNDGIRLLVSTNSASAPRTADLEVTLAGGATFTEHHVLHNGSTFFDLSEYFREAIPVDFRRLLYVPTEGNVSLPFATFNAGGQIVLLKGLVTALIVTIDSTEHELNAGELEVVYGYTKFEKSQRIHLFNPNFEAVAEYVPTIEDGEKTVFGLCYNRNNGNDPLWYEHLSEPTTDAVRQVRLNDYWDVTYNREGIALEFMQNELDSETATYIIDTRSKGAYLRFLDADGLLQQLLLDIENRENAYEDGELVVTYQGGVRYYEEAFGAQILRGHGQTSKRVHTQVLHCSVSNMPKGLITDLKALALSPVVLLYRGDNRWEQVRVVPTETIVDDSKKAHVSAKFDVYPIYENAYSL